MTWLDMKAADVPTLHQADGGTLRRGPLLHTCLQGLDAFPKNEVRRFWTQVYWVSNM